MHWRRKWQPTPVFLPGESHGWAAHEAEEESDNIAEDFLEGKTDIDDFLSSFMEKRTVCNILWLRTSDSVISNYLCIRSDQISRSVVSDSSRPHESQHARPPCPSPALGVHSDSHPSSQ